MLPFNPGGHADYLDFIFNQLHKYYPNPDSLPRDTREIIEHFYQKDLSHVDEMLKDVTLSLVLHLGFLPA
ncbi:MAG: hypothetical protein ACI4CT_07670 [Lachnospiraceae bacterium]